MRKKESRSQMLKYLGWIDVGQPISEIRFFYNLKKKQENG